MIGGEEESSGIGARIGLIEGPLIPDSTEASRFRLTQGGIVSLNIRVKNTGGLTISPFWWLRVHHSATIGTGSMVKEWTGQITNLTPTQIVSIIRNNMDSAPVGWRDVFLKVSPTADMSQPSYSGGEDNWADAYEVTAPPVAGVSILDLTLS